MQPTGKRTTTVQFIIVALIAVTVTLLVSRLNTPWVPYVSRSNIPRPVVVRIQNTNGTLRVFQGFTGAFILLPDGSLWRWGPGGGWGFPVAMVPEQVGTNCDWVQASSANGQCVALRADGTFWHWGNDYSLPVVSPTPLRGFITSPEQVGAEKDWASVATGDQHSVVLKKDGTVWAWGHDEFGQMGNGLGFKETNLVRLGGFQVHPIQTNLVQVGTNRDWVAIGSAYGSDTVGLRADGTLWVWGQVRQFLNGKAGAIFWVPTRICRETNWLEIEGNIAFNRNGEVWQLFYAPPDASAPAAATCQLITSNCVPGRFAMVPSELCQLHVDGTLWATELKWSRSGFTLGGRWHQVGQRSDWVSLRGIGTALGLTSDGTLWLWGCDQGQNGVMPPGLRLHLIQERIQGWVGWAPVKPHTPGWITPIQREPRPLMRILATAPTQMKGPEAPR